MFTTDRLGKRDLGARNSSEGNIKVVLERGSRGTPEEESGMLVRGHGFRHVPRAGV